MKEQDVKRAVSDAEKELKAEKQKEYDIQVAEVKEIVKRTLEEIESLKGKKENIDEELKILKLDIDDLKQGKLERIKERQEKDPKAKEISIIIIKEKETIREVPSSDRYTPWYQPYYIQWNTEKYPRDNQFYCDNGNYTYSDNSGNMPLSTLALNPTVSAGVDDNVICNYNDITPKVVQFKLNNSVVKDNTIGTYKISKKIIHLR